MNLAFTVQKQIFQITPTFQISIHDVLEENQRVTECLSELINTEIPLVIAKLKPCKKDQSFVNECAF